MKECADVISINRSCYSEKLKKKPCRTSFSLVGRGWGSSFELRGQKLEEEQERGLVLLWEL